MNFDFAVTLSEVCEHKLVTMETGVKPNGDPIYRVAVFDGVGWTSARYDNLRDAYITYIFLRNVV